MTAAGSHSELRLAAGVAGRPVLVTGGAGFIGTNLSDHLLAAGTPVLIFDNLSRPGSERNLDLLRERHGTLVRAQIADVRDSAALQRAVAAADRVVHLAAQVAVTTSVQDPVLDFEVNTVGTLNLLNALRALAAPPPLLYTSTNKVYGCLSDVALERAGRRYQPIDAALRARGIDETRPLAFHGPYGCSKGAADQYVIDYARTYGLQAAVFRMSCIYGPHQFGTEDQGWVAHFMISALNGEPLTVFGDGRQVRDILFVDDLVDAIELAFTHMDAISGHAFNVGGGQAHTTSLTELIGLIGQYTARPPIVRYDAWRTGDQRYYVSDTTRFSALTGWQPRRAIDEGVAALWRWLSETAPAGAAVAPPASAAWSDRLAAAAGER